LYCDKFEDSESDSESSLGLSNKSREQKLMAADAGHRIFSDESKIIWTLYPLDDSNGEARRSGEGLPED
jgi:hypothetical protein